MPNKTVRTERGLFITLNNDWLRIDTSSERRTQYGVGGQS